ncbi:hypothetical protein OVS_02455 [Mycoplasma ovis str. Michigan]|uniref:Uncharacterized protein n=1 Tax=Mycoplasma ovis str. Michigan TaxID=1415773 RepID=A0ABM5P1L5_9MOLU|nr:hypothetical protein OVS_02455 [Mycoplasma ovis str. Michigan]
MFQKIEINILFYIRHNPPPIHIFNISKNSWKIELFLQTFWEERKRNKKLSKLIKKSNRSFLWISY